VLVARLTNFRASRKDPLGDVLDRVHGAFLSAFGREPEIQFTLADGMVPGGVSSVDRVLKRFPQMERFYFSGTPMPAIPEVRQLSNGLISPVVGEQPDFATLLQIAQGVPRSFPFHNIHIQFHDPAFGAPITQLAVVAVKKPGIDIADSWWVNGRSRSMMALTVVDVESQSKKLPPLPEGVAQVIAACGKAGKPQQLLLEPAVADSASRVAAIMRDYRTRLPMILDQAMLPHALPSAQDALTLTRGMVSGPKKPALVEVFRPLGYDCKGETGTFTLRRRTPANLTVEVSLDVGTWSNSLTGFYEVQGVGFTAKLPLPPSRLAMGMPQYPIGDAALWQQITENLGALVKELDRTFVPEIESVTGPAPEWFRP
jgi:hypothetical protein